MFSAILAALQILTAEPLPCVIEGAHYEESQHLMGVMIDCSVPYRLVLIDPEGRVRRDIEYSDSGNRHRIVVFKVTDWEASVYQVALQKQDQPHQS